MTMTTTTVTAAASSPAIASSPSTAASSTASPGSSSGAGLQIIRPQIVVIGTSAGGLRALEAVLSQLPASFSLPVVAVQHRSRESEAFAAVVGRLTKLPVYEAEDKDEIVAPGVYIAPPDYHLLLEPGRVALSTDEPVGYSRPSIDVLFESAADAYGASVIGVLLTGANHDGARGLARIRAAGGIAIVQDPATAESPEMPTAAITSGAVDRILPLNDIASELVRRSM